MKSFVIGLVIGVLVVPLVVYAYFAWGFAPVATSAPTMPFEKMLARKALSARIEKEMPKTVPIAGDEAGYLAGVQVYRQNCAVCHGLPLEAPTAISKGMFPKPPQLFRGKGVTDDEPGETYWKVANGIRMSGMPGYSQTLPRRRCGRSAYCWRTRTSCRRRRKWRWLQARRKRRMRRKVLAGFSRRFRV